MGSGVVTCTGLVVTGSVPGVVATAAAPGHQLQLLSGTQLHWPQSLFVSGHPGTSEGRMETFGSGLGKGWTGCSPQLEQTASGTQRQEPQSLKFLGHKGTEELPVPEPGGFTGGCGWSSEHQEHVELGTHWQFPQSTCVSGQPTTLEGLGSMSVSGSTLVSLLSTSGPPMQKSHVCSGTQRQGPQSLKFAGQFSTVEGRTVAELLVGTPRRDAEARAAKVTATLKIGDMC